MLHFSIYQPYPFFSSVTLFPRCLQTDDEDEESGNITADEDSVNVSLDDGSEADEVGAAAAAGEETASGSTPPPSAVAVTQAGGGDDADNGDDIPEDIQRSPKSNSKWQSAK